MQGSRQLEAYCTGCAEPTHHVTTEDDPGRCRCLVCGREQALMVPVE